MTTIHDFLAAHRNEQNAFLAELVRVPSDNPPGDCAPHAERAAHLLEAMGFKVERHSVPADTVQDPSEFWLQWAALDAMSYWTVVLPLARASMVAVR